MAELKVISWNVRGLNTAVKRSLVFKFLQKHQPQICILQETHLQGTKTICLNKTWVGLHYHSTFSTYARGVSILVHKTVPFRLLEVKTDKEGRYVILYANIYDKNVVLVGLYIPPPANGNVLHEIMQTVVQYDTTFVYLLGDFNMAPSVEQDRLHRSARDTPDLRQWADLYALTDVWRHIYPTSKVFTCHSASHKTLSRIDLIYASCPALQFVKDISVLPRGISDHTPLCLTLTLTAPPGPRLWRLSKFWADDERLQEPLTAAICNFWTDNVDSAPPIVLWDTFKAWARGEFMTSIARLKRDSAHELEELERRAAILEADLWP